jgi:Cd2+/Zn2+-exporting ATPase
MVAGLSSAARLGVLVKSVVDLESARNLSAMVFDKTGTLTTGKLQVTRMKPAEGVEPADMLRAAAAVEQNSRHPAARAVVEVARRAKLKLAEATGVCETAGKGVIAKVAGQSVMVGRASWFDTSNADENALAAINLAQNSDEAQGLSLLFVVRDRRLLGWIGLEDNARAGAADAVDELRDLGFKKLTIVTGDRESVAKRVAAQMHTDYRSEVLPQDKLDMVNELRRQGHRVAVVGDGVNDAPALSAGDVSIAMGAAGSDVAIHAASITLMNNNLNRIPFLVRLSKLTSRIVRQNLAIGVCFILMGAVAAAMGYINPVFAAVVHVVSALVVIFNSARLVRMGEDIEQAEHEELAKAEGVRPTRAIPAPPEAATA